MSQTQPPRILVTRSEPGASETAARLRASGFAPIVEPLFAIKQIADSRWQWRTHASCLLHGITELGGVRCCQRDDRTLQPGSPRSMQANRRVRINHLTRMVPRPAHRHRHIV